MKQHLIQQITALCLGLTSAFSAEAQFLGPHLLPPSTGLQQQLVNYHYADLDADGHEDLLTAKWTRQPGTATYYCAVEWHRNNGAGGYEAGRQICALTDNYFQFVAEIKTADLDGDGWTDLVYRSEYTLAWQTNFGAGNFGPLTTLQISTSFVELGDLDGDGDLDLVADPPVAGVQWFANDGANQFQDPAFIVPQIMYIRALRLVDLNDDTKPDMIVSGAAPDLLRWYPNLGDGTFGTAVAIDDHVPEDLKFADVDGDGDTDIVGAFNDNSPGAANGLLMWWANDGAGSFSTPVSIFSSPPPFDRSIFQDITVADLNGDNAPDILAMLSLPELLDDYNVTIWTNQNNGAGDFTQTDSMATPEFRAPRATDLNSDGLPEITLPQGNSIFLIQNDGSGELGPVGRLHETMQAVQYLQVGNLNGDSLPDFAYFRPNTDGLAGWHLNLGGGQFGALQQVTADFSAPEKALAGDLDGDSDLDFLLHRPPFSITRQTNDGAGNFGAETQILHLYDFHSLHDLDGDLDLDLVCFSNATDQFGWLANDGAGNFSNFQAFNFQHQETGPVHFGDLDNDGDLDLMTAGVTLLEELFWYENTGNGVFANDQLARTSVDATLGVSNADMDGDGDQDILVGNQWLVNDGDNIFYTQPPQFFDLSQNGFFRSMAADFDQDGDNDIVTASIADANTYPPGSFALFENLGNGEMAEPRYFGKVADCIGIQTVDVDGDSDLDVVWYSSYDIGWWENIRGTPYISGSSFWDKNENKIWDAGEPPITGIKLRLQPAGLLTFAEPDGEFRFYVSSGDYTLSYIPNSCWERTTDSAEYHLSSAGTTLSGYQFGFKRSNGDRNTRPLIAGGFPRCNTIVQFRISLDNRSCNESAGRLALVLDGLVTFAYAVPWPFAVTGDTLWWNFDTIQPFAMSQISVHLQLSGPAGDTIRLQAFTWLDEPNGSYTFSETTSYWTTVSCSFDPNDKLVDRPTVPPDYVAAEHELTYTIRFQNTGNDTAFLVRLRDTLSPDLDWTTLRPLGSSHPFYTVLNTQTGLLQFTFEDIILPDSATNFAESQGFVQFAIQLQPGLSPGTVVSNRAGIYFDANPVVLTNTAETQVLTPVSTHTPVEPPFLLIQPNPTTGICTLRLAQPAAQGALLEVLDAQGRRLRNLAMLPGALEQTLDLGAFPAGLYLVKLVQTGQATATAKIIRH